MQFNSIYASGGVDIDWVFQYSELKHVSLQQRSTTVQSHSHSIRYSFSSVFHRKIP